MDSGQRVAIHPVRQHLRRASAICGLSAILLIALGWSGLILMVGGFILPPWILGAVLSGVSVVLARIGRKTRIDLKDQDQPTARSWERFFSRALIALSIAGSVLAFLGDAVYSATYTNLEPVGPDGCRAVVRETSFLMLGEGHVYAVHPWGVGWLTGSWTADDGVRPIEDGSYRLSWSVGGGSLLLQGNGGNPVWPGLHEVSCL